MRLFEDDLDFLPLYQRNWVNRFYASWHYVQFMKKKSIKQKKLILGSYLTQLVGLMKDARSEVAFLRRFVDRDRTYQFVFDKARREARAKMQVRVARKQSSLVEKMDLEDLCDKVNGLLNSKKISSSEDIFLRHIISLGWDNGTRLATIYRLDLQWLEAGTDIFEALVWDKNSTVEKVRLPLRVRPDLWNAAAGLQHVPKHSALFYIPCLKVFFFSFLLALAWSSTDGPM